jgi:hypothetical protein
MKAARIAGTPGAPRPDGLWAGRHAGGPARTTAGGRANAFVGGAVVGSAVLL